jgi:L-2-amino-thiazoline-4-carboxylic acid hydrolase
VTEDRVPASEARDAVQNMSRRVALLHLCFARTLVDELGEEKGRELIRKAIWDYGTRVGKQSRRRVEAMGLDPTIENFAKGSDLSSIGFDSQQIVIDGEPRSQSAGCVLAEVWHEYGEDELGSLYCQVDPAKVQAYHPAWTLVHTKKIPDGDECCEQAIRRLRKGVASLDTD